MKKNSRMIILSVALAAAPILAWSIGSQNAALPEEVARIIKQSCGVTGCHSGKYPAAGLNFEPEKFLATVLNAPSQELPGLKIVNSGNPENSYLLMKIMGDPQIKGQRMPFKRDPLKNEEIQAIRDWLMSLKENPAGLGMADEDRPSPGESYESSGTSQTAGKMAAPMFDKPAFWGTRLVNLPTTTTPGPGEFMFRISHRFQPPISAGWDEFYGLDGPAFILPEFAYGISDQIAVRLGRSRLYKEWAIGLDWRLLEQGAFSGLPLEATLHFGGSLVSQEWPAGLDFKPGRGKINLEMSFSYQLSRGLSFLVVPAYASNTNHWERSSDGTFSLGFGGRMMVLDDLSLIVEWVPVLAGYKDISNGWGVGVEKKIGGHVFQVFVTNSLGLTPAQYLTGGDLKLSEGDFRIGFNIFRTF